MIARVLAAVDDSPDAGNVLDAASEIALRFDATVVPFRAIHVVEPGNASVAPASGDAQTSKRRALELLAPLLERLVARCDAPLIAWGEPWRAIVGAADDLNVNLVVVGSGCDHASEHGLGSTARRVVDESSRTVLVVRDTWKWSLRTGGQRRGSRRAV